MTRYLVQPARSKPGFLEIITTFDTRKTERLIVQLSHWRPGRYEAAHYSRNVYGFSAFSQDGLRQLPVRKISQCAWEIDVSGESHVDFWLLYKCRQLDAGGSWVDDSLFYLNPVNCLPFNPESVDSPCELIVRLPQQVRYACSLRSKVIPLEDEIEIHFSAPDYHELADSPILAAADLKSNAFHLQGTTFHLWFWGQVELDWNKITDHFTRFAEAQLAIFGSFPTDVYHFMFLITPHAFYHGVEHQQSTVCVLGPGEKFNHSLYADFLGVSSHELFHMWNVKNIRPADFLPYNYTSDHYSTLGYVYEGFTTYYGDLALSRASVFSVEEYLDELNTLFKRHGLNYGYERMSLADASVDTWVDGYGSGPAHRRVSIYVEGALNALLIDLLLRRLSHGEENLDHVMRVLYLDYGLKQEGYSKEDLIQILSDRVDFDWDAHFKQFIETPTSPVFALQDELRHLGLDLVAVKDTDPVAMAFGCRLKAIDQDWYEVSDCVPKSPAHTAGLLPGCKVRAASLDAGSTLWTGKDELNRETTFQLESDGQSWYNVYAAKPIEKASAEQKKRFMEWCGQNHPAKA